MAYAEEETGVTGTINGLVQRLVEVEIFTTQAFGAALASELHPIVEVAGDFAALVRPAAEVEAETTRIDFMHIRVALAKQAARLKDLGESKTQYYDEDDVGMMTW